MLCSEEAKIKVLREACERERAKTSEKEAEGRKAREELDIVRREVSDIHVLIYLLISSFLFYSLLVSFRSPHFSSTPYSLIIV